MLEWERRPIGGGLSLLTYEICRTLIHGETSRPDAARRWRGVLSGFGEAKWQFSRELAIVESFSYSATPFIRLGAF